LWLPEADIGAGVDVDFVVGRATVREIQCARDPVGDTTLVVRLRAARRGVKNALLQRPVQVCESYPFFLILDVVVWDHLGLSYVF
jgi:hypothetical protein